MTRITRQGVFRTWRVTTAKSYSMMLKWVIDHRMKRSSRTKKVFHIGTFFSTDKLEGKDLVSYPKKKLNWDNCFNPKYFIRVLIDELALSRALPIVITYESFSHKPINNSSCYWFEGRFLCAGPWGFMRPFVIFDKVITPKYLWRSLIDPSVLWSARMFVGISTFCSHRLLKSSSSSSVQRRLQFYVFCSLRFFDWETNWSNCVMRCLAPSNVILQSKSFEFE